MAKPQKADNVEPIKGQQAGVSNDKIKHIVTTIETARSHAKDYTDSANEAVKAFGEDGGHKAAIRNVAKFKRMAPDEFLALWRAMEHYADVCGLFDQADMFEDDTGKRLN